MISITIKYNRSKCLCCAGCVSICPKNAITFTHMRPEVDSKQCVDCSICVKFCPVGAILISKEE